MRSSPLAESSVPPSSVRPASALTPRMPLAGIPETPAPEYLPRRRAHFDAWYLDLGDHGSPREFARLVARERLLEWDADGSGSVLITSEAGVTSRTVFAPGTMSVVFPEAPPAAARAMETYLRESASVDDATDPVQVMDAVAELLNEWTLPASHQSAVVLLLARLAGITVTGVVVDRLGRAGVGYLAESPTDARFTGLLVVSELGDRILAIETTYRGGVDELDIAAPSAVRSIVWR
jgi:hypothetical protein